MDDLDLQPASHRRPSEKLPVQPGAPSPQGQAPQGPVSHGQAPQRPAPVVQSVPPVRHFDSPPSTQRQPMNIVPVIVGVAALGAIAYFFLGQGDAPTTPEGGNTSSQSTARTTDKNSLTSDEARALAANQKAIDDERNREIARNAQKQIEMEKAARIAAEKERADREHAIKLAQDQKQRDEQQARIKEGHELRRKEAAGKRLQSMKRGIEQDATRHLQNLMRREVEVAEIEAEKVTVETSERAVTAAKNQAEYSRKKLEEASTAHKNSVARFGPNNESSVLLKSRADAIQRDIDRYEAILSKAETERANAVRSAHKKKVVEDMIVSLTRTYSERLADLDRLKDDKDYDELLRMNDPIDSARFSESMRLKLIKEIPNADIVKKNADLLRGATTPVASSPKQNTAVETAGPGVTVATKKEKVTIYTMKDGKKISAVKAVDADDQLSLKTVDGKFVSIFKDDIVKQEEAE